VLARLQQDELDTGPRHRGAGTQRLCVATGAVKPVAEMIRFVVSPDGVAVPDLKHRLPGRGMLERGALEALAIAHKAGSVAIGFAKVETAIARGTVVGLVHAADAARDGVRKLKAALRQRFADKADGIATIDAFTSTQLDLALGRPNVIHAALLAGPASKTFLARVERLGRFRADGDRNGRDEDL